MNIILITSFISVLTYIVITYNLGLIEFKKKFFIINLLIVYLTIGIGCLHFEAFVLPLFLIIMMILLFIQNKKFIQNFISVILSIIIFLLSDTIQGSIFLKIFKEDSHKLTSNNVVLILMQIILFIFAFIISSFISSIFKNEKFDLKRLDFRNMSSKLIFFNILLTALIFYINAMMIKYLKIDNIIIWVDSVLFLSYFFSSLIMTYIVATHIKKDVEYRNKRIEFDNLQEYTSNLESMYNDMRKFKHDYINILSSMTGYFEHKDIDGLEDFFNKKILNLSQNISTNNFNLDKLQNIKIYPLKGILSSKVIKSQELGIDVFIDIMEPIENINIDIIDLCISIGILLDNAIDASLLCEAPSLKIGMIQKNNSILVLIINSCLKENPPIYKMFEKGFSTKGSNRGLGLSNLNEIIKNYSNITLDTSIKEGYFFQNLQISN